MLGRKVLVSQQVLGGVGQERRGLRETRLQPLDDLLQLGQGTGMVWLGEHRADDRRHGFLGPVGDQRQQVPHEVDAALPARPAEYLPDRVFQPLVGIGDHQAHAAQTPLHEAAEKRRPEGPLFRGPSSTPSTCRSPSGGDPDRDRRRLAHDPAVDPTL